MPKFQVTSPSGSSYEITVPEGEENLPDFQEKLKRQVAAYEQTYAQSGASAFGSGALQGLTSVVAEPVRGAGELFGVDSLTSLGEELAGTAKYTAPISPLMEDSWAAQGGQALGQGVGQLGLALASGGAVGALGKGLSAAAKAKAVQAAVLGPAFFAGAAGGADESRRLGLEEGSAEDIANKLLYGGSELLSESIFGLGSKAFSRELVSDAPRALLRGAKTTAIGRGARAIGQEAVEEPIAGGLQDISSRIAVKIGGQGDFFGSTTENGAELRNPFDVKARLTEAALGAIGAGPFGVRAAMQGDSSVDEVRAYRSKVNLARKDGSIKAADQGEIDALDTKAKDFLELEGVPLMRNAAQSVLDDTAQGVVELKAIINDTSAAPAVRAAAQVKLERFKEQGKRVVEQTDKFLAGDISLADLRTSVAEYDNLNPFSAVNQDKQLAAAEAARSAAPVTQTAQANADAGNTATAAALLDTQAARQRAGALRAQARADRKAPVTQQPAQAPTPAQGTAPAATPAPNRRDQIVKRLAEIEAKLGPRDYVTIGANGQPDVVRPYRANTLEEANLLKEIEALNAAEAAAPAAATPTSTQASGVSIGNLDALIAGGGGTVQVVERGQRVPFKQFGLAIDGDTAEVAFVEKELSSRAGVGYDAYVELGNQLAARGIKLRSSKAQYGPGKKVWVKLANQGRARSIGQGAYEFMPAAAVPTSTQAPAVSSREQAAREVEASYDEAVRAALPQVDTLVNESLPALVNQVSQAMADGDFETASNLSDQLTREAARLQRFDAPEIQRAFGRTLTPEQQDDFKRKRAAAEQLAKDVQRTVAARAKSSGTPVGTAVAERMAPKPTQAELPLDTPPVTPQGEVPTTATEGPPMSRDSSTPQTPAVDEFGLSVEDAPADQAAIDAAFAELETQREAPAPAETPQEAPAPAETPPATATEPVVSELDAIDAELAANKLKREQARQRARAAYGRLGFFGGDPVEQAIADGRVWKANVELGYLLLKKGYVRFKIWAREYLRQNADDPSSMRLLRRIYRMLRDDPASAASLLNVPEDQIASLSGGMDASINNVSLAPEPQIKDPGYFGAIENVLDWAGNTTFFEGRKSVPGGGKSHRIYLDEVIEGLTYNVVYRYEGKTYRTGDRVSRHGGEWLFGYGVGEGPRASRFRKYSTTQLVASFTGGESASRVAEDTRRNIIAFNQIAQFEASGRLAFSRREEVARWISSVRYEKDDFRFPVTGTILDNEIAIKLAGTEDVIGRFTLQDGVWVFGSGEVLTKTEQGVQDSFAVVGFELEDSSGNTTSVDTPAKVVTAWPSKSKTYNPLDGFGPAPMNPEGKRVKPKASEPAFKNYADLEAWITAKRMRQGHSLDINKMRRYVRERGPRSFRKYVDKALASAEKAYAAAYPAEQTSLPVFKARDNKNIGVQYARMVQDTAGSRPLFTNNVFETAVQLNMGLKVFVPEGFAGAVHPLIQVNPTTREVISASDASGKVSKEGDHLAVRQRDPNVLAKSEARMATEDEMNEALLDDFDFVDGLPKAANEDSMLKEASRKFASMRFSSSASKPFDRAMVDLVATANLFAETRLVTLIPAIEETGYSKDGVILDPAKLPQAVAAVRAFIESRRQQAKEQRATLQELGESTREVEEISVLPDRLEGLVKSAAKAMVLRNNAGAINYGAYWNRALRRVMQRYNTRINSGFAAPVATTQYNEEGSEQIDPNDEQQVAAALAAGDISMTGSSLTFDEVVDETDEPEGGFVNPKKTQGKAVQLDLFGKETTEEEEPDAEDTAPVVEEDEPELAENNDLGVALNTEVAAEPELTDAERFQISPEIAAKRNRGQRSTMRRILRDLPVNLRNAVFNSPTTDRFDVVLTTYYSMRAALIRSGIIRSEERPTFREAMDLVFKNQNKVKGLDKLFSNSVKEALGQMSRAHAKAPGIPKARAAKAAADALGLVDGDVQSAIDALTRAASLQEIDFGTRMLAKKIAALRGVSALRGFSMIPMESARGTMLRDRAIINISPSGSTTELIETLMHEFVHLSTEQAFQDLESGTADEAVVRADEELTVLREELARYAYQNMGSALFNEYAQAFDNNSEFLSYLFSDSKFNAWVSARPQSFLIRVANAIRKLLGLKVPANTTLDKAWRAVLLMSDRPAMFAQTAEAVDRDALEIILMSIDQQGPGTEARNLMAGANARRLPEALKDSFSKARDMDTAGESKSKIRQETGWYRAPTDKQWRWEINDKDSKLNVALFQNMEVEGSVVGSVTDLEILFSHPELYKAYPELRTVQVRKSPASDPNRGSYGPAGFTINESVSPEQARLTLLHEIQHWIQRYEGFFRGTSLDTVRSLIKDGTLTSADMFSMAGMAALDVNFVQAIYYRWPGELEARMVSSRADLTDEERRQVPVGPNYPVNAAVVKLRTLAATGGIQASYEVADTGIEVSTERDSAGWYDSRSDTIKINPDVIAEETQFMSPRASREYMTRLMLHENTHRSDAYTDTTAARVAYSNAMSEADFEWIAKHYYVDPARREFALGRTPGMTQEQKVKERQILVLEHRVAMIELAKKGETLSQFAIFAASNPGLLSHIKRLLMRFVRLLAARVRKFHYQGSARDLQGVMETLNYIEDIAPSPAGEEEFIADASSVAVPIMSRRLGTYKVGGWATTGFLNQETAEQQRVRDAKLRAMQARVQMHKDDLARAVKKEYTSRGLANPESLINEALGSIENPVNPQQLAVAEQLRTRAVRNAVSKFLGQQNLARSQSDPAQGSLIRENARTAYQSELIQARKIKERYLNKVESDWVTAAKAKQAAAFASLSPETSTVARAIRDDIDAMQQQLIQSGVLGPKTAARVTKTFGIYLTRSYQVYNENIVTVSGVKRNLWNEFLRDSKDPKSVAILDAARAAIFEDAVKEKAKELKLANTRARNPIGPFQSLADRDVAIKAAQRANPVLDSATALSRARAMLQSNGGVEVETMLEKYLEMGENMDSDTDVLKRRDAIHPAIQALWGVYEQNEYNAFNTMMKINALLANQSLFEEIYKHGKASGYIFDKEGVVVDGQRTVPLGGTGTQANRNRFGILAGKYGPAELKAGLEEVFGGNTQSTSSLWNFLRATTGYAMATKTKYSIQGIARNFVGNIMFAGINLNLHKLFDPRARGVVARQLGLKAKNKTEYDNYIRRLIELRVVSESAYEFRDLTREFSQEALGWVNRATKGRKSLSAVVETVRKLDKVAGVAHQGADDFWKVLSFEGELARVKKWEPNLTQEQAEQKAAWKIRNTMPTYTEAFYFIKRLRQQPFIAPFITFTAEVYRTTFGTLRVGLNEIAEGKVNGNQGQMIAGLARISNLVMAVGFMPTLMAMLGKAAFGAGEDDEEDLNPGAGEEALRRFVPEYMRKNSIMRFGSGKWEEQIYMDASYLIPHDVLGKVLRSAFDAYMKPETIGVAQKAVDAGLAFMEQVLEPVTNDQLFFGSVMQAKFNYNQAYDRKIYKDTDTGWEATQAVIAHIYTSALEPGTVRTGRLIMEAADGVVRDGMKMEVGNEMLSVGGIKKRTVMLETRFARNADEYKKTMGEAATYITAPLQSNSTVEDADIKRGYDRANEVRMANLREVRRDYLAATYLGMPQAKAKQLLLDSQLSDDDVASVVGNFYTPYQVSDQVFNKALEKSKAFGQDRVRLYLNAAKQYPKRQPLIPE